MTVGSGEGSIGSHILKGLETFDLQTSDQKDSFFRGKARCNQPNHMIESMKVLKLARGATSWYDTWLASFTEQMVHTVRYKRSYRRIGGNLGKIYSALSYWSFVEVELFYSLEKGGPTRICPFGADVTVPPHLHNVNNEPLSESIRLSFLKLLRTACLTTTATILFMLLQASRVSFQTSQTPSLISVFTPTHYFSLCFKLIQFFFPAAQNYAPCHRRVRACCRHCSTSHCVPRSPISSSATPSPCSCPCPCRSSNRDYRVCSSTNV